MKKIFVRVAGLVAAAVLVSAGVMPAHATGAPALPAGQQMFTFDFDGSPSYLWKIDSTDAGLAPIGLGTPDNSFLSPQQNPADGRVYAVGFDGTVPTYLASIDMTTGVGDKIHNFVDGPFLTIQILFNNAGDAFAIGNDGPGEPTYIYDVDLDSAVLSNPRSAGIPGLCEVGFAFNPVDDTLYGFCDGDVYRINPATGAATAEPSRDLVIEDYLCPGTTETCTLYPQDYAFDANGNLWVTGDQFDVELFFFDFATGAQTFVGQMHEVTPSFYPSAPDNKVNTYGLLITSEGAGSSNGGSSSEELAVTGMNDGVNALAVLAAAGIVAAVAIRRRARV